MLPLIPVVLTSVVTTVATLYLYEQQKRTPQKSAKKAAPIEDNSETASAVEEESATGEVEQTKETNVEPEQPPEPERSNFQDYF